MKRFPPLTRSLASPHFALFNRTEEGKDAILEIAARWDVTFVPQPGSSLPGALTTPGALGLWATKLRVWTLGFDAGSPVITLEGDTEPLRGWEGLPEGWRDYDLLFLHSHEHAREGGGCGGENGIREGPRFWYATGSMLFTAQNRARWEEAIRGTEVRLNDDWWINEMWEEGKLRVGQICRPYFRQHIDQESTIREGEEWT